jgi:hypothetical protein
MKYKHGEQAMKLNKEILRQLVLEVLDEEQLSLPNAVSQTPTAAQTQAATYAKTRMTNDRAGVEQEISSGGLERYKTNPQEARAAITQAREFEQQWRKQQGNPVSTAMAEYFKARAVAITALQQQGAKERVQNTPQQQVLPGLGR